MVRVPFVVAAVSFISCCSKIQNDLTFWYWFTRVPGMLAVKASVDMSCLMISCCARLRQRDSRTAVVVFVVNR